MNELTLKQCLTWLINNGYGILVENEFVLTNKVNKELNGTESTKAITVTTHKPITTVAKIVNATDKKEVWNKFIKDADIPHRVTAPNGGQYTVRHFGAAAVNELVKILSNPDIDYTAFVESTKNYYKTVAYKSLLSNYLLKQIWVGEYEQWIKGNSQKQVQAGENRFED